MTVDVDAVVLPLHPDQFTPMERVLLRSPRMRVSGFLCPSGVAAMRVQTERVESVLLPFRGQQVWRHAVDGEELTMRTHFSEPSASTVFGETYGPFLLHCGLTGIGAPSPDDTHAHHGEIPNAPYEEVELRLLTSAGVDTLTLTGLTRIRVSHSVSASFRPRLSISSDSTALSLEMDITNHRHHPLSYSYLCHINWAPVDGARLVQPVEPAPPWFKVDPHPGQSEATALYTAEITADPSRSNRIDLSQELLPEYCAVLTPTPDDDGWVEFLMVRPDGKDASVRYDATRLPHAIRWISNTGDEAAAGFCLPSTAHHHGRAAADADGMLVALGPGETHTLQVITDLRSAGD